MEQENQDQMIQFEEEKDGEEQQDPNQVQPSPQTDNKEEQVAKYDENYNQEQQQQIEEQKPQEIEQKPINVIQEGDEGFLGKLKCCRSHQPAEEQTDSPLKIVLSKLDNLIQKYLTPFYLLLVYYAVFTTILLYFLKLVFIDKDLIHAEILGGLFVVSLILKGILIYLLSDEWIDELPYLDSRLENGMRITYLTIMILTNLDLFAWVYYIYAAKKRDGAIEHMMALCRMIDSFFLNFPLMIIFFYLQMIDIDHFKIEYLILSGLNMLQIVNGFMHLNFFGGSSFLSIKWSFLFLCDLYVKSLLVVSVFCQLIEYQIHYGYFGLYILFGLIQFYLLSDDQDTFGKIMSFFYFQFKTFFVIIFKEDSLGMQELDCDAQPGIFNVHISQTSFTYTQKAINFLQIVSLCFVFWLFGGLKEMDTHPIQQYLFLGGLVCFGISFINLLYTSLSGWKKNMVKEYIQKQ